MAIAARARALSVVTLLLRVITLGLLAASLVVIATTARTQYDQFYLQDYNDDYAVVQAYEEVIINFQDLYTYRYVLSAAAIGCAYTLVLIPLAIIAVVQQGRKIVLGTSAARILIFTDVVFCTLFTSGGAAGLGLVVDSQHRNGKVFDSAHRKFYISFDTSCGLLLAAAICTVAMIMISAYSK